MELMETMDKWETPRTRETRMYISDGRDYMRNNELFGIQQNQGRESKAVEWHLHKLTVGASGARTCYKQLWTSNVGCDTDVCMRMHPTIQDFFVIYYNPLTPWMKEPQFGRQEADCGDVPIAE